MLLGAAQSAFGHGVQIGYGTLANGFVRVYVEHWHGDHPGLTGSPLNITITNSSGTTTQTYNAMGEVPNTAWNNLPGLGSSIHILSQCPGEANTYNDWLYWDFAPGSCNTPVTITINSGTTVVTTEACAGVYPQTITGQVFTDQGAPVITANNITAVGDCTGANLMFASSISVVDDCDKNPVVTYSQPNGSFFPVGTTVLTITATDNTGKTSVKTINVTVIAGDSIAPTLTVPASFTVNADPNACSAVVNFSASATDNCSTPTVVSTPASGSTFPVGNTTVTTVATDAAGNKTTKTFVVTVKDTQAPTLNVPGTVVASALPGVCYAQPTFAATAGDNCGAVNISYSPAPGSSFPRGNTIVTATAVDAAGNTTSGTFAVVVLDLQAPVLTSPASNATVEADGSGNSAALAAWINSHAGATATDNCGQLTWINNFNGLSQTCGAGGTATVTFTVLDSSGNHVATTATFTVVDTKAPVIVTPASNKTVECNAANNAAAAQAWVASNGGATATDASAFTWTNNYAGLTGNSVTVTFTATDACGNASSTTATFNVIDTTAPTITASASDKTVECDGAGNTAALSAWLAGNGGAVATDACSAVTWTNNFSSLTAGCGATGSTTVTFVATDASGNTSSTTATFVIVDTTAPAVTAASNKVVECDGSGNTAALAAWVASNGGATAQDTCSSVTWSNNFTGLTAACGATGSATVTFTATDACGNTSSTTATFTIVDTTAPALLAASNKVVECDGSGNTAALAAWVASHGGASATDTCGSVTWSNNFTGLTAACGATGSATVTFTATDACGNTSSTTATFTIVDTTAPVLSSTTHDILPKDAPISFTISATDICSSATTTITNVTAQAVNGKGQVVDKSGSAVWSVSGGTINIVNAGGVGTYFTITASAVDACGNTTPGTYVVNVLRPANEGVGNGVDGNTPGDTHNGGNDSAGTSPGNPGAKGKK